MPDNSKMITKQYIAKAETSDDDNTAIAMINSGLVDRDKEVMLAKGVDLTNWQKSPRVLWAHEYDKEPIGKGYWIKRSAGGLKSKWEWAPTPEAQQKRLLWDKGFLNTISIGFIPAEGGYHAPTTKELREHPEWAEAKRIYDKWELLEYSVVPVAADPNALALAIKTKQINISPELQKELNLPEEKEEEETFYAAGNKEKAASEADQDGGYVSPDGDFAKAIKVAVNIVDKPAIEEKTIETDTFIETDPVITTERYVDIEGMAKEAICKVKGIVYI